MRDDRWYRAYWDIRSWLARAEGLGHTGCSLKRPLFDGPVAFERALKEFSEVSDRFDPPFTYQSEFVTDGHRLSAEAYDAICAEEPKVNVYQAAICIMSDSGWDGNHMHERLLFRGESSDHWSVREFVPSIYRGVDDWNQLSQRRRILDVAAHWFRKRFTDRTDSDLEVLAILQHHGQMTWLLDLTTSPYVALFFASRGDNGRGVVYSYSLEEFDSLHELAPELIGQLRQIKPRFVPRIDRQYGVFVDGGHGWTTRHLVRHQLTFSQSPHFRFEDAGLGVTKHCLLSTTGDWGWFDSDLPVNLSSVDELPHDGDCSNSDVLTSDIAAELRKDAESAPRLVLPDPELPVWPPKVEQLASSAERYLARWPEIKEARRHAAAQAIAQYHHFLCDDPDCSFYIRSFHAYFNAIDALKDALIDDTNVNAGSLVRCYTNRADFHENLEVLLRAKRKLLSESHSET